MESDCILIDDVARRNQNISFSRFFFLLLLTNHLRKRLRHDSSAQNIKSHSIIRFFFCDNLFNLQVFGRELRILPLAKCGYILSTNQRTRHRNSIGKLCPSFESLLLLQCNSLTSERELHHFCLCCLCAARSEALLCLFHSGLYNTRAALILKCKIKWDTVSPSDTGHGIKRN